MSTVSPKPVSDAEGPACPCHADKSRVQVSEAAAGLSAGTTSGVMPPKCTPCCTDAHACFTSRTLLCQIVAAISPDVFDV